MPVVTPSTLQRTKKRSTVPSRAGKTTSELPLGLGERQELPKCSTGIRGLDEVTAGGLPRGRPTLVCGGAGCGKTLLGVEFLVRGAVEHGEPGVFASFEETEEELVRNVASLGFDLRALVEEKKILVDQIHVDRREIEETGDYDLEGLFIRLGHAIDSVGAKRVVLDTIESLFSALSNEAILRSELRRLFRWLKDKGVTTIITAERGQGQLTRQGLEEYVSDCVILLDHRVEGQISTRRMRIVKYRGSIHATNEFPFLIDERGIAVVPITSLGLAHRASSDRVSTGIDRLDAMLGGHGFFKGSSILVTGMAGTGKSTLAAHLAASSAKRGERCLYFAFEESPAQITRNMSSVGLDLAPLVSRGLLTFIAARPTFYGLEMHLAKMHKAISEMRPAVIIVDPLTSLIHAGTAAEASAMLVRLVDFLKSHEITSLFTALTHAEYAVASSMGVSSLMDTWLLVRDVESDGEHNRALTIVKSRGMGHSNQVREFILSSRGVELRDVYLGSGGVKMGSAREVREAQDADEESERRRGFEERERALDRKRIEIRAQIAAFQADLAAEEQALERLKQQEGNRRARMLDLKEDVARRRQSATSNGEPVATRSRKGGARGLA
jgi:circadian clock protein KaiC